MSVASDLAELSTLQSQINELLARVTNMAVRYGVTPDSAVSADLFAAERALANAHRAVNRVVDVLQETS